VEDLGLSGAAYHQEVEGLFTAFSGLVYTLAREEGGNIADPPEGQTFSRVISGVDWGYTNPTAAVVFGLDGGTRAWQVAELSRRRAPLQAEVLPALVELTRKYGVQTWYCGPDEPEHISAMQLALLDADLSCRAIPANDAVRAGIQTITSLLSPRTDGMRGLYVSPSCGLTLAEYAAYQYPPDSLDASVNARRGFGPLGTAGTAAARTPELPLKVNDHLMDATRYALHTYMSEIRSVDVYLRQVQRRVELRQRLSDRQRGA
jgi:hypothetical protein